MTSVCKLNYIIKNSFYWNFKTNKSFMLIFDLKLMNDSNKLIILSNFWFKANYLYFKIILKINMYLFRHKCLLLNLIFFGDNKKAENQAQSHFPLFLN